MGDCNESIESKEMEKTTGPIKHKDVLFQTSRNGIFQGKVKPFEPSTRLIEQFQREDICKEQSLENMYCYPLYGFLNELKSHVDNSLDAKDEKTQHKSSLLQTQNESLRAKSNLSLVIQLLSIEFHEHHHFNEEERLARSLCEEIEKFHELKESGKKEYFNSRLVALTKRISECFNHHPPLDINIIFEDIQSTMNEIASAEHEIYSGYMSVVQKWNDLKSLRANQGFQSTTVMLEKEAVEDIDSLHGMKQCLTLLESKTSWLLEHLSRSSKENEQRDYREELMTILWTGNVIMSTVSTRHEIHIIQNDIQYLSNIALYPSEQRRRSLLQAEKYLVRFIINGNVVLQTRVNEVSWPSWTLELDEKVICSLSKFPDHIHIQIFRRRFGLLPDEFISETEIICPGREISNNANQLTMLGVTEASTTFSSSSKTRDIRGIIHYTIGWTIAEEHPTSSLELAPVGVPPLRDQKIIGQRYHKLSSNRCIQPTNCHGIDELTISLLRRYATAFRMQGTNHLYMNSSRVQEPLRHYMIRQREYGHPEYNGEIPLLDSDFSVKRRNHLIAEKEKILNYEESMTHMASSERTAVPEEHIRALIKRILQTRNSKFGSVSSLRFDDIVYDESYIRSHIPPQDIGLMLESMICKARSGFERLGTKVDLSRNGRANRILLTALNVDNAPYRDTKRSNEGHGMLSSPPRIRRITSTRSDANLFINNDLIKPSTCQPRNYLIQVSLDGKKYETQIGKDHLELPINLDSRNEILTPVMLRRPGKNICMSVFDLIDVHVGNEKFQFHSGADISILREKRFLGFAEIPLLALYSQNNIRSDISVLLNKPPIIFGYSTEGDQFVESNSVDVEEGPTLRRKMLSTSIQISTLIEQQVHVMTHPIHSISSNYEIQQLIDYSRKWIQQFHLTNQFSARREVVLFGDHMDENCHLLTQYLKPQNPPPEFTSFHQVAHFVSLIPRLRTWKSFECDHENLLWITNQQVLDISAADWEARAILLANYFLSFVDAVQSVFLVFGTSCSEGKVVYVMISNYYGRMRFWNPWTGSSFSEEDDEICPLMNIDCLVSTNNIFGNTQAAGRPSILNFNISDRLAWMPFFDPHRNPYKQLESIQEPYLFYSGPNIQFALKIELDIKERIKAEIRSWRNAPTKFNTDISDRLGMILTDLEDRKCNGLQLESSSNYLRTISDVCLEKEVFGFPLHFSFTNIEEIIDRIHITEIYEAKHPQVEFAFAVKVFPYASNLNSVWVFLCTIV